MGVGGGGAVTEQQPRGLDSTDAPAQRRHQVAASFLLSFPPLGHFVATLNSSGCQRQLTRSAVDPEDDWTRVGWGVVGGRGVRTFLPVSAAELVPNLGPPGLPQQDLDQEGVLGVGRDHHFLDVGIRGAFVPAENEKE